MDALADLKVVLAVLADQKAEVDALAAGQKAKVDALAEGRKAGLDALADQKTAARIILRHRHQKRTESDMTIRDRA